MIGEAKELDSLLEEYTSDESKGFCYQLKTLCNNYMIRRVRGDGNCFYRAFLFAYLDKLLVGLSDTEKKNGALKELERFKGIISKSLSDLVSVGYSEFALEIFSDMLIELLEQLRSMTREALLEDSRREAMETKLHGICELLLLGI